MEGDAVRAQLGESVHRLDRVQGVAGGVAEGVARLPAHGPQPEGELVGGGGGPVGAHGIPWGIEGGSGRVEQVGSGSGRGPAGDRLQRVGQERLEGELGGADEGGVGAQGGHHEPDLRRPARPARCGPPPRAPCRRRRRSTSASAPPRMTTSGLSMLTTLAVPRPSQVATSCSAAVAARSPSKAAATTSRTPAMPPPGRPLGELEETLLAALRLPAAGRAAVAHQPGGVHDGVADLAGESGPAGERHPAREDPGADARVPGEVDGVVDPRRGTAHVLGPHPRSASLPTLTVSRARRPAARPSGTSRQPRFGRLLDAAVLPADHARHGDPDAGHRRPGRDLGEQAAGLAQDGRRHGPRATAPGAAAPAAVPPREHARRPGPPAPPSGG